jgi:SAM-dependent methyltransferase
MFRPGDREKCLRLVDRYYSGRKFHDALYRELIGKYLQPGCKLLDAGCGRRMAFCSELSGVAQVVGIDLDSLDTQNERSPFGVRGDLGGLPFPSNYFDVIISRSVVEHLENPNEVFREFSRVLRTGGIAVISTPNKYDYVSLIAAITPYRLHRMLVAKIFHVSEDDVFPTLYRSNTKSAIRRALNSAGFAERELETVSHYPAYLSFSPLLFRLGVLYEKLTSLKNFGFLRGTILCVFEKRETEQTVRRPMSAVDNADLLSNATAGR